MFLFHPGIEKVPDEPRQVRRTRRNFEKQISYFKERLSRDL